MRFRLIKSTTHLCKQQKMSLPLVSIWMANAIFSPVATDGLSHLGARLSANSVLTKFESRGRPAVEGTIFESYRCIMSFNFCMRTKANVINVARQIPSYTS